MRVNKFMFWGALQGKCPKCKKGKIFKQFINLKKACPKCDLNLESSDVGDGAAFFSICIVGTLITLLALYFDNIHPLSIYAHALLWVPMAVLLSLLNLRLFKALLIWMQYEFRSDEYDEE